ncbi:MAG: hypothetical protein HQ546_00485, partial [Planctomycetes bacterium]|nr:hypothetical protein [Planctomycetota bacterium]
MPQTLSEIRAMLASAGLSPRKSFGQHFLIDHNLLAIMVKLSNVGPGDVVLEVGPGTGTLTDALLATGAKVLAVEIDRGLAGLLADRYAGTSALRLICCDVLADKHNISGEVLQALHQFGTDCVHLVSNLPYNIATPLICECLLSSAAAARADRQAVMFKT